MITASDAPVRRFHRSGNQCARTRSVTKNQMPADRALVSAAITLTRWATVGAMGRIANMWPRITKNGLPGGCGMPSTFAAVRYSLVSHIAVLGSSVTTYKTNTAHAAIAAAPYEGRSFDAGLGIPGWTRGCDPGVALPGCPPKCLAGLRAELPRRTALPNCLV